MADQQRDVIEVLEHDHREVEEMFKELESLRDAATDEDKERRKAVTEQVTIELVRHSVAEEILVYPEVERKVSAEEVEHAREEHAEAEETLQKLEKLDADAAAPERAERGAAAGGGGAGGFALRPHARPRDRPRQGRLSRRPQPCAAARAAATSG